MDADVTISVGDRFRFLARLEHAAAPATCAAFRRLLPYAQRLVHCRWSGEGCWIPLGAFQIGVGVENATSTPRPGEILWYSGSVSETEVLFPYGDVAFACRAGALAGNHFLTIVDGMEQLPELGAACCTRARTTFTSTCADRLGSDRPADRARRACAPTMDARR